jgi:ribosomal protein S1
MKNIYKLGDKVTIKVVKVDIGQGQIDFILTDEDPQK